MMPLFPSIGPNLFSDALALWFGLFVINRLLEQETEERERPARAAAWRSVHRLHSAIVQFVDDCIEHNWTVPDAPCLWAAYDQQDGKPLGPLLRRMLIDAPSEDRAPRLISGRFAAEVYFSKAADEADRFISRYVSVAHAEAVAIVERFETLTITLALNHKGLKVQHIAEECWDELFEVEFALRQLLLEARAGAYRDTLGSPRQLLPNLEEWLEPKPGWTEVARSAVAPPRSPER